MRTYTFDVTTSQIIDLITITRLDEQVIRVCNWPRPITISSEIWQPVGGLKVGDVTERDDGTPSSMSLDVVTKRGGIFDSKDIAFKKFEGATLEAYITNARNPASKDLNFLGQMGESRRTGLNMVRFEARSPYAFAPDILIRTFTLMCPWDFGDYINPSKVGGCKMPILPDDRAVSTAYPIGSFARFRFTSAGTPEDYANVYLEATTGGTSSASTTPTISSTVGNTSTDGSVTWTTRNAWTRGACVATIVDPHNIVLDRDPDARATADDTWYQPGTVLIRSGYGYLTRARSGAWDGSARLLTLYKPVGLVLAVGDWLEIWPDCDKTLAMCRDKYDNTDNYGGFRHYEGAKAVASP